jgi:4-hydroxy-tetrahydrodipicolinate reductase
MSIKIGLIGSKGRLGKAIMALDPTIVPIYKETPRFPLECDVLIDVSSHHALLENLSANKPIVIGTTGHLNFELIEEAAKRFPCFYAANFSLGAALMARFADFMGKHFQSEVDLIETHHVLKKDAPSGTALHLAKRLKNAKISSIRSGDAIGEHILIFKTVEEKITFAHEVHTRDAFARGALAAARFLAGKPPGLYGMDNLFDEAL